MNTVVLSSRLHFISIYNKDDDDCNSNLSYIVYIILKEKNIMTQLNKFTYNIFVLLYELKNYTKLKYNNLLQSAVHSCAWDMTLKSDRWGLVQG